MEYRYWHIEYTSCESNFRWTIARAPAEWDAYEVESAIQMGGCGDDPAEITSIEESNSIDYSWDLTLINY